MRLMRDVFTTAGQLLFDELGHLVEIRSNAAVSLVKPRLHGLQQLLKPLHVAVNLDKA